MPATDTHEQHFTEGEPDLEPPEEFAMAELDDVAVLEEELDNEDVLEQDVEEDVLEETLEDLVHGGDDDDGDDEAATPTVADSYDGAARGLDDAEDLGVDEEEEGLDQMLEHLLAVDDHKTDDEAADADDAPATNSHGRSTRESLEEIEPCGDGEFTCKACFLVRNRTQLADPLSMTCSDCGA